MDTNTLSVAAQIALHLACIIRKRIAGKDAQFHRDGIARAMQQLAPAK